MKKEEIKSRIDELTEKLEKKELKGFAIKKAKDEIENLEIELSELEDSEVEGDESAEEVVESKEIEEKLPEVKEVKKEKTEDILEGFKNPIEEVKESIIVEAKKVEELPDVEVATAGKKKYKFTYHTPNGETMTLHFRKGKKELVRYGKFLWLTDDEYSCFPQWLKPVK